MSTLKWHQPKVEPFDEAEFYQPGPVVTVQGDGWAITVYSEGERDWAYVEADESVTKRLTKAEDFRAEFPDGKLPETTWAETKGWVVNYNGWFDLYSDNPADGEQGHLDDVSYSLNEAIASAENGIIETEA